MGDERTWTLWRCTACGCTFLEEDGKSKVCSLHGLDRNVEVEKIHVVPLFRAEAAEAKVEKLREALKKIAGMDYRGPLPQQQSVARAALADQQGGQR